jgi:phage terminase large subunit-like protein
MTIKEELIQYSKDCITGKIISGKKHKQACKRFLNDIKREGKNFWVWDEEEARKIVNWFTFLKRRQSDYDRSELVCSSYLFRL